MFISKIRVSNCVRRTIKTSTSLFTPQGDAGLISGPEANPPTQSDSLLTLRLTLKSLCLYIFLNISLTNDDWITCH